jgi:hypothetical protein
MLAITRMACNMEMGWKAEGAGAACSKIGGAQRELVRCRRAAARGRGMLVAAAVAAVLMRRAAGERTEGEGVCSGGVHVSILRPMSGEYVEDDAPVGAGAALWRWPETELLPGALLSCLAWVLLRVAAALIAWCVASGA